MTRRALRLVLWLVAFVVGVNLVWFVAPILGNSDVYRPLFAIVVIVVADAVWRQITRRPS